VEGHVLEDAALDSTGEVPDVHEVAVGNTWLDIEMACRLSRQATLWRFPLETISGSEAGFERVYQGSCVVLLWLLTLPPGQSVDLELEWVYRRPSMRNV
jgi:alpha-amylase